MTTITKERLLTIKQWRETYGPGSNVVLPAEEAEELARIALASLEAEPVAYIFKHPAGKLFWALTDESNKEQADVIPVYAAAPVSVVPDNASEPLAYAYKELTPEIMRNHLAVFERYGIAPNDSSTTIQALRIALDGIERSAAMLQSLGEGNPHVTPARLPGGFTIEDAKELHEDLVRSHISQALSGEKMKKKDRDADLRWIHGVIVQAAWFVKASLEKNALSGTPPVTPDGWISCSERMPEKNQNVLISVNFDSSLVEPLICSARYTGSTFRRGEATIKPGNGIEQATHWMPLPEPPREVNQ
ncbi:TPA: DUF551 domain-containing protein [Escherichia coli]|nr:DUF551 domain-containing protein [Escherichia coli]MBN6417804.1 DUF551 domain-containing protein [Escherichia coli]HAV8200442.1 DUF551 domain-containing protein [Escherichia coli]HAV8260230.1 DUF551 domain-containing protein [Escherichia coli]HAV8721443.1 DUF551 domain-containing protein [Escherichia coli]